MKTIAVLLSMIAFHGAIQSHAKDAPPPPRKTIGPDSMPLPCPGPPPNTPKCEDGPNGLICTCPSKQ